MTAKALVYANLRHHRKIVRIVLEQEGFYVSEAATLKDAALGAWIEHPELILVSLDDGALGLEFARGLRSSRAFEEVRLIGYSLDGPMFDDVTVQLAGFDGYAIGRSSVLSVRSAIRALALHPLVE